MLSKLCLRQQLTEKKRRSQEELESMTMLDEFPALDGLKCVLKDGSQIAMLEGLQGIIAGLALAAALDLKVS